MLLQLQRLAAGAILFITYAENKIENFIAMVQSLT